MISNKIRNKIAIVYLFSKKVVWNVSVQYNIEISKENIIIK